MPGKRAPRRGGPKRGWCDIAQLLRVLGRWLVRGCEEGRSRQQPCGQVAVRELATASFPEDQKPWPGAVVFKLQVETH